MPRNKHRQQVPRVKSTQSNQLRIIAGQWRGRKLSFPSIEGLRPTPDRVRETLFNWLAGELTGASCLDLFAGSGALGLEALSRGASQVDMIDSAPQAIKQLKDNMTLLGCPSSQAQLANALQWLNQQTEGAHYDILFLDPPFHTGLAADCIDLLRHKNILKSRAWVYLEMGNDETLPVIPPHWQLHREKIAGQVRYQLYFVES